MRRTRTRGGRNGRRVRTWLGSVPDSEWDHPTRCDLWDMTALVRHMASTSQYLGYTLHQAASGEPTTLLRDFDTHETVKVGMDMLGEKAPAEALDAITSMDTAVDIELDRVHDAGWSVVAEAPLGHLSADLAVSHFFFDSWVHEYDLMLPRGEQPLKVPLEAEVAVRYLIGLAAVATGTTQPVELRLTNPDLVVGLQVMNGTVEITVGSAPRGAAVIEADVVNLVDRATGRPTDGVRGDDRALAVLDGFGRLLAT